MYKFWFLKSCPRCHGDMFREDLENVCLQCGYRQDVKLELFFSPFPAPQHKLGRKPKGIPVKNISDTLQRTKSITLTAEMLRCSRGYIYQELKKAGTNPQEVMRYDDNN